MTVEKRLIFEYSTFNNLACFIKDKLLNLQKIQFLLTVDLTVFLLHMAGVCIPSALQAVDIQQIETD